MHYFILHKAPKHFSGFLFTLSLGFLFFTIITMFKWEITLDDVIKFIIENYEDREAMDKISQVSFPFTTKYLEWNKRRQQREETITLTPLTPTTPTYPFGGLTYCSDGITWDDVE